MKKERCASILTRPICSICIALWVLSILVCCDLSLAYVEPTLGTMTVVSGPPSVNGKLIAISGTQMGATPAGPITGELVYVGLACNEVNNTITPYAGKIAMAIRGNCDFDDKYLNTPLAIAYILYNNVDNGVFDFSPNTVDKGYPAIMVGKDSGELLVDALQNKTDTVNLTIPFERCSGTKILTANNGTIRTQKIAGAYAPNMDCTFIITPASGKAVTLWFENLWLADGDFVTVYNGTGTTLASGVWNELAKYKASTTAEGNIFSKVEYIPIGESGCPSVAVKFTSNADNERIQGFTGHYVVCTGSEAEPANIRDSSSGYVGSAVVGSQYGCGHGKNCTWIITTPSFSNPIHLMFTSWHMSWIDSLGDAKLTIRSGLTLESTMIATLQNLTYFPQSVFSATGKMRLDLYMPSSIDQNYGGRVNIDAKYIGGPIVFQGGRCDQNGPAYLTGYEGTWNDGSKPADKYGISMDCWYFITPYDSVQTTLTFPVFDTENGYDLLTIYALDSNNNPVLTRTLEVLGGTTTKRVTSPAYGLAAHFESDSAVTLKGYTANYYSALCDGSSAVTVKHPAGRIVNASLPANADASKCLWRIDQFNSKIGIRFYIHNLELVAGRDSLSIYEGTEVDKSKLLWQTTTTMTKDQYPTNLYSNNTQALIVSNSSVVKPEGFRFEVVYHSGSCSFPVRMYALSGVISDGTFNGDYLQSQDCTFHITPPQTQAKIRTFVLKFNVLDLAPGDYIHIYRNLEPGISTAGKTPDVLLQFGSTVKDHTIFGSSLLIVFHSSTGAKTDREGFQGTYTAASTCPAGYYVNSNSSDVEGYTCFGCPVGSYSLLGTSSNCTKCSPGHYNPNLNSGQCMECQKGEYQDEWGKSSCEQCDKGKATNNTASILCNDCDPGYYSEGKGSFVCTQCKIGQYQPAKGKDSCDLCPLDSYCNQKGMKASNKCPQNSFAGRGSVSMSDCQCMNGFTGNAGTGKACEKCPQGAECLGGNSVPAFSKQGYYGEAGSTVFLPCWPSHACLSNGTCSAGYQDRMCGQCSTNYFRFGDECLPCVSQDRNEGTNTFLFVLFCLLPFIIGFIFIRSAYTVVKVGGMAVLLEFVQNLMVINSYSLKWPILTRGISQTLGLFNFNIQLFGPQCVATTLNYWSEWGIVLLLPIIFFCVLCVIGMCHYGVIQLLARHRNVQATPQPTASKTDDYLTETPRAGFWQLSIDEIKAYYINSFFMFLSVGYNYIAMKTVEPLQCTLEADDSWSLNADKSLNCYDDAWYSYAAWIVLGMIFYVVGIPFVMMYVLYRNRNRLDTEYARMRYGTIYRVYDEKMWFWNSGVKLYKLALIIPTVILSSTVWFQWLAGVLVLLAILILNMRTRPHRFLLNNRLSYICYIFMLIYMLCGALFYAERMSEEEEFVMQVLLATFTIIITVLVVIGIIIELLTYKKRALVGKLAARYRFIGSLVSMRKLMTTSSEVEMADFAKQKYMLRNDGSVVGQKDLVNVFDATLRLVTAQIFQDWMSQATEGEQINSHQFLRSLHYYLWVKPGVMKTGGVSSDQPPPPPPQSALMSGLAVEDTAEPQMQPSESLRHTRTRDGGQSSWIMKGMQSIARTKSKKELEVEPPTGGSSAGAAASSSAAQSPFSDGRRI